MGLSSPSTDRQCRISLVVGAACWICTIAASSCCKRTLAPQIQPLLVGVPRTDRRTRSLDPSSSLSDPGLPSHDPARPHRIQWSCCHREKKRAEVLLLLDPELLLPCRNPTLGRATARQQKDMPPLTSLRTH